VPTLWVKIWKWRMDVNMNILKRLAVALVIISLVACTARSTFQENRQKWASQAVTHYRFQLSMVCLCPWNDILPVTVEVKDGQVVSMVDKDGQPIPSNFANSFNQVATVDKMFDVLDSAIDKADSVKVEYDPLYGFPKSIQIDYIKAAMDDEISYYIAGFELLK
jgi:hypothetical protein